MEIMGIEAKFVFSDLKGNNRKFIEILETAKRVALSDQNILVIGESGTGKELLAHAIHNYSHRRNGPFVALNCAAIPHELVVSELFGYEDGAFTGAKRGGKPGKFELADDGTLFLDEIGDMPLYAQATLLRAISGQEVVRLGGSKVRKVNVRIIAATNKNIADMAKAGTFRSDLYYRIAGAVLKIPPLRERKDDIPILCDHILRHINDSSLTNNKKLSKTALKYLTEYDWPGNVRELENALEYAFYAAGDRDIIDVEDFKNLGFAYGQSGYNTCDEEDIIKDALVQSGYNISEAARRLGISRSTLYNKLKKYNIERI